MTKFALRGQHYCNCQLPTVNCQLPTANCQLSTANCQLSTVNCQLPHIFLHNTKNARFVNSYLDYSCL
ncbi:MAG: hypothetical protein EAZ28_31590 [Oscillatoriales cyanobacterium]|nr:MAG: hypothetical protein EAZ28_31590 [Oscillatoriales cyanobacterium]